MQKCDGSHVAQQGTPRDEHPSDDPVTLQLDVCRTSPGAGQGVGRGLALAFAAAGAEIQLNDLRGECADSVVEEVLAAGVTAM